MFCNNISYSRTEFNIFRNNSENPQSNQIKNITPKCLGGASAAYARELIKPAPGQEIKTTTKIALICHVVYSIFKGLLQGLCSFFLTGNKRTILALHSRHNLIFPSIELTADFYDNFCKGLNITKFHPLTHSEWNDLNRDGFIHRHRFDSSDGNDFL